MCITATYIDYFNFQIVRYNFRGTVCHSDFNFTNKRINFNAILQPNCSLLTATRQKSLLLYVGPEVYRAGNIKFSEE
jgi:hypothetical protein